MQKLNPRQKTIIEIIKGHNPVAFSTIFEQFTDDVSERTIKRDLTELVQLGYINTIGGGRSTEYEINISGRLLLPIDADMYNATDLDKRPGVCERYTFSLWETWPQTLFSQSELESLTSATFAYSERSEKQSPDIHKRELERFVIEMSWKSSQIEGNTYTLLDTERLLKEGIPSNTNSQAETQMILNHKKAFDFTLTHQEQFRSNLSFGLIETLHQNLMENLLIDQGLRTGVVGITGSRYKPLDNQHQLREALENFLSAVNRCDDVFSQALTTLLGISYIQPFTDGNKRTARLFANGILISHGYAPLSYRDIDERDYRATLLVFYEQLSIISMKELFISQYNFSTEHYTGLK